MSENGVAQSGQSSEMTRCNGMCRTYSGHIKQMVRLHWGTGKFEKPKFQNFRHKCGNAMRSRLVS